MGASNSSTRHQRSNLTIISSVSFGDLQSTSFAASTLGRKIESGKMSYIYFGMGMRDINCGAYSQSKRKTSYWVHIYTYVLLPARSVPKRGTKYKQIDKQIDKHSPHIRSRLNWEHVLIGARHAHTDPPASILSSHFLRGPIWT